MKRLMCKRLAGVAVTALALTLAGCGGSSNKDEDPPASPSGPSAELSSARATYGTADRRVGNLTENSAVTEIRDAHEARVAAANALLAVETDSEEREKVAEARGTSMQAAEDARERISEAAEEEEDETRMTNNAASMQVAMAILDHSTAMDAANTPDEFTVTDEDDTGLRITRGSGDAMIKLNQDDDAAKDKKFEMGTAPDAGTGWMGKTFTYTDSEGKKPMESAAVYTNIEMAKDADWNTDGLDSSGVSIAGEFGVVTIATTASVDVTRFTGDILPSAPPSGQSAVKPHKANANQDGMFYGVSGKFSCAVACTVTRNSEGEISVSGGALTFTPTIPSGKTVSDLKAKYAMADVDYLHFGYWMESTKQKDDTYKHVIQTFSGGGDAAVGANDFDDIDGKATYSGAAAGHYVKKSDFDADGDAGVVEDGTFVADVALTAQFGEEKAGTVALANQWSIEGEISNFMDGDEDLGWTLMLNKADLGGRNDGTNIVGNPAATLDDGATTTGSAGARGGSWSGTMYGNAGSGTDEATDDHPTGVSGEFNGHFANGHVAGAFGAMKD